MREAALPYARLRGQSASSLYYIAWSRLAASATRPLARLTITVKVATALADREPANSKFRCLLGLAHWRAGNPTDALAALGVEPPPDAQNAAMECWLIWR